MNLIARRLLIAAALLPTGAWAQAPETSDTDTETSVELQQMTIFGTAEALQRATGSAHLVDEQTLEAFDYADIHRILNVVPGVYVRGEDGYGLRPNIGIRGGNSDRSQKVTLMEDGVLFGPAPYAAPAAYYFPLSQRMTGVEVFKGPAAIQYGPQTIGGAINLLSAPLPDRRAGLLALTGGSDADRSLHARAATPLGDHALQAELVYLGSDGFKTLDGGGDTGFDKAEGLLKYGRELGQGRLVLRVGAATETSDETYLGLTEEDFRSDPTRRYRGSALDEMTWDWHGLRADIEHPLWGGDLHVTAYDHRFDRAWTKFNNFRGADIRDVLANPDTPRNQLFYQGLTGEADTTPGAGDDDLLIGTNDRSFRSSGLQARYVRHLGGRLDHSLRLGLRLHSDRIRRLHDELAYEMVDGQLERNNAPRSITANNTGRANALALWVQDEMVVGRWTIVPGLRMEAVQTEFVDRRAGAKNRNRNVTLLPGIGVSFAQTRSLTWIGGVHRGYSPASPGLSDAEPEDAWNAEAGFRWQGSPVAIELVAFLSDYSNLTGICTFSSGCDDAQLGEQTNAGSVSVAGLETTVSRMQPLTAGLTLQLEASHTWTNGEFDESFDSSNPQFGAVEAGFELPYVPEHRANLLLGLRANRWQADASVTYVSAMRDQAGRGEIPDDSGSDAYTVLDVAGRYQVTPRVDITARVDNLLDEVYVVSRRPFGARPGRPLAARVGVEMRW